MKNMKSIAIKFLAITLSVLLTLSCSLVPAYADDTVSTDIELAKEATELMSGIEIITFDNFQDAFFDCDFSSILDTSSFYKAASYLDNSAFGQLAYEIPTSVEHASVLNLEYSALMDAMEQAGWGVEITLEVPSLSPGYSVSITERFDEIYGDMSNRTNLSATMPDGWSMDEIMSQSALHRNEYSDILRDLKFNTLYQDVLTSISAGNAFQAANATLTIPDLRKATELNTLLSHSAAGLDAEWDAIKMNGVELIQKEAADNKATLDFSSNQELQDLFEEACGKTDAWLNITSESYFSQDSLDESKTRAMLLKFAIENASTDYLADQFLSGGAPGIMDQITTKPSKFG